MTRTAIVTALVAGLALSTLSALGAAEDSREREAKLQEREAKQELTTGKTAEPPPATSTTPGLPPPPAVGIYVPPKRPAPGRRVGGGTRGTDEDLCAARLEALAPEDHAGVTAQASPVLYWFVEWRDPRGPQCRVDFTLSDVEDADAAHTMLERTLAAPLANGFHAIALRDFGVELEPGRSYQWSVAVVLDPGNPSRSLDAGGFVVRADPPAELRAELEGASAIAAATAWARHGFWYDALAGFSAGSDPEAGRARAAMLAQVGLGWIVTGERAAAR